MRDKWEMEQMFSYLFDLYIYNIYNENTFYTFLWISGSLDQIPSVLWESEFPQLDTRALKKTKRCFSFLRKIVFKHYFIDPIFYFLGEGLDHFSVLIC